jgi:hypothetical protein
MMAMTGNHTAMKTADTVFVKHLGTGRNVAVCPADAARPAQLQGAQQLLLTSSRMSLSQLRKEDARVKEGSFPRHRRSTGGR